MAEIDLDGATWTTPAARMKMKRPHRMPLSPRAVAVLKEAHDLFGGTGRLFPGMKKGRPLSDVALSMTVKGPGYRLPDVLPHLGLGSGPIDLPAAA